MKIKRAFLEIADQVQRLEQADEDLKEAIIRSPGDWLLDGDLTCELLSQRLPDYGAKINLTDFEYDDLVGIVQSDTPKNAKHFYEYLWHTLPDAATQEELPTDERSAK